LEFSTFFGCYFLLISGVNKIFVVFLCTVVENYYIFALLLIKTNKKMKNLMAMFIAIMGMCGVLYILLGVLTVIDFITL
tara:strand:+ start:484 stop:720 length:237 start_codon:yes stop_codon:yes gene_type:complete